MKLKDFEGLMVTTAVEGSTVNTFILRFNNGATIEVVAEEVITPQGRGLEDIGEFEESGP